MVKITCVVYLASCPSPADLSPVSLYFVPKVLPFMLVQKMCTKYKHLFIFRCLEVLEKSPSIHTVDITGGAPELCPEFRYLVEGVNQLNKRVIDRCNLTVLLEPGKFISLIESDNLAPF